MTGRMLNVNGGADVVKNTCLSNGENIVDKLSIKTTYL